jgi:FkbM family methyltransferase
MINRIVRRILYKILGDKNYLLLVSNIFLRMYHSGRAKKKYSELYFLKNLVKEGDVCIDIGANLGYYSIPLAELVGETGKVYAVEPVQLFKNVLERNLKNYNVSTQVEVIPFALGDTDNKEMEMGTPVVDGLIHFGYTKILTSHENVIKNTYKVKVNRPQTLFKDLEKLDFIKCDIEGYEGKVIPEFVETIKKFKPTIQIEISSEENREMIFSILKRIQYRVFYYMDSNLIELMGAGDSLKKSGDLYFLQPGVITSLRDLLQLRQF